jgi:hypothetical protein
MIAIEYYGTAIGFNSINDIWNIPLGKTIKGQKEK